MVIGAAKGVGAVRSYIFLYLYRDSPQGVVQSCLTSSIQDAGRVLSNMQLQNPVESWEEDGRSRTPMLLFRNAFSHTFLVTVSGQVDNWPGEKVSCQTIARTESPNATIGLAYFMDASCYHYWKEQAESLPPLPSCFLLTPLLPQRRSTTTSGPISLQFHRQEVEEGTWGQHKPAMCTSVPTVVLNPPVEKTVQLRWIDGFAVGVGTNATGLDPEIESRCGSGRRIGTCPVKPRLPLPSLDHYLRAADSPSMGRGEGKPLRTPPLLPGSMRHGSCFFPSSTAPFRLWHSRLSPERPGPGGRGVRCRPFAGHSRSSLLHFLACPGQTKPACAYYLHLLARTTNVCVLLPLQHSLKILLQVVSEGLLARASSNPVLLPRLLSKVCRESG